MTDDVHSHDGIDRRTMLQAACGTAAAAALAGCSALLGGDDGDDGGQDGGGDVGTEPLSAGLLTFTKGAAGVLGIQAQRGAELAVQRINENGGIAGQREVQLDVVDEGSEPLDSYNQFIEEGKDVTFGPISSGTHESIAPEIEQAEVVNVSTDGTVTTLYEETVTDPTYSFRFQNYDVMECVTMAREAVERIGADNINTVAGINPGYSFGEDEMAVFTSAIQKLTGAEVVYEGFPDLGASDMSTHISAINSEQPDVTFSSLWGGDVTTFMRQANANNMFENTTVVGTTLYSAAGDVPAEPLRNADVYSGSRNFYWNEPSTANWPPGQALFDAASQQDGVTVPTAHYMSGYGAVTAWATAVEKAITLLGEYPSQLQIAQMLEGHGFFTPAGYHNMSQGHQGKSNSFAGEMVYDDDLGAAVLEDVNVYSATETAPPPGMTSADWISGWG
ncbi:ABC transporter substrate-binding protein [Haloarchaeobius sp. HRN-SO-5]|uniref:ABC transporter substrate-binding protein n=1 Tax=Haloarchaeobius sp. HRN-SO-5 TaxID=3446118 RepID=UPI003EB9E567